MNHLTSFKRKVFICELVCIMFFIVTGVIVFAMVEVPEKKGDAPSEHSSTIAGKKTADESQKWEPVVELDDGTEKRIVSLNEFFKLARASSSVANSDVGMPLAELVKLKQQVELGGKQIELLEKMIKKIDYIE